MTNKQIETRILNLERQLLNLATREGKRANEAESAIIGNTSEIASVKAFGEETAEKTSVNEEVLDYVMGEALPEQDFKNEELESTLDYILTEVIPPLMGNE